MTEHDTEKLAAVLDGVWRDSWTKSAVLTALQGTNADEPPRPADWCVIGSAGLLDDLRLCGDIDVLVLCSDGFPDLAGYEVSPGYDMMAYKEDLIALGGRVAFYRSIEPVLYGLKLNIIWCLDKDEYLCRKHAQLAAQWIQEETKYALSRADRVSLFRAVRGDK